MMPLPALLVVGPLLLAVPLLFVARRWPVAGGVVGGISALVLRALLSDASSGFGVASVEVGRWVILGHALVLTEGLRQVLLFIYIVAAALFFLSALWPQGSDFVPAAFATFSLLAAILMVQSFVFSMVLLMISATIMAVLIQSGPVASTRAALRYLLMTSVAVALSLLAGWIVGSGSLAFLGTAWRLLLISFLILLAGFPFHIWVRPVVSETAPLATVFSLGFGQLVLVLLAGGVLLALPTVRQDTQLLTLMRLVGAATVAVSALLALGSQDWGRLIGYILLAEMGAVLLALSFDMDGMSTVLALLVSRVGSLALIGLGLAAVKKSFGANAIDRKRDLFTDYQGLAWREPLAVALLIVGVLSLTGLPLTPGFSGRWMIISLAATASPTYAVLLVLATASGVIGAMRALVPMLQRSAPPERSFWVRFQRESLLEQIAQGVLVLALVAAVLWTVFPNYLLSAASRFAVPGF